MPRKFRGISRFRAVGLLTAWVVSSFFFLVASPALAENHGTPGGIRVHEEILNMTIEGGTGTLIKLDCLDPQGKLLGVCWFRSIGWELLANGAVVHSGESEAGYYDTVIEVPTCAGESYIMRAWAITEAGDRLTDSVSFTTPADHSSAPECANRTVATGQVAGIRITELDLEAGVSADHRNFRLDCRDSQGARLQRCGLRQGGWELLANGDVVDSRSFPGGEIYYNDITVKTCPGTDYTMRASIVTRAGDRLTDSVSFTTPASQNLPPDCATTIVAASTDVVHIRLAPKGLAAGQSAKYRNFKLDCRDPEGNRLRICEHRSGGWELLANGSVVASTTLPRGETYDVAITVGIQPETSYTLQAWMVTDEGVRLTDSVSFTTPGGIKHLYSFTRRSTGSLLD